MFIKLLEKIFGTKSMRDVRKMLPLVARINTLEVEYQKLSDDELMKERNRLLNLLEVGITFDEN